MNNFPALLTVDGQSLLAAKLPPIQFVVDDLLPQGLFILAGSPKVGKSWLSLMLSHRVTSGDHLWGRKVNQGSVLYLALEDTLNRLQTRYQKYSLDGSPLLHFAIRASTIKDCLVPQVDSFIQSHPDTRMVIVDTMQQVRGAATDKNPYVNDYNDMSILREITNKYNVSLLLITHTRKMDDPDPLNRISGSTGLVGAVDGVFILEKEERTSNKARLTIANRDTDGHVFHLEFVPASCRWELLEEELADYREEPIFPFLVALLAEKKSWEGTATELCKLALDYGVGMEYTPATIAKRLRTNEQILFTKYGVDIQHTIHNNTKIIRLRRSEDTAFR